MNRIEVNRIKETKLGFTKVNECTEPPNQFEFDFIFSLLYHYSMAIVKMNRVKPRV